VRSKRFGCRRSRRSPRVHRRRRGARRLLRPARRRSERADRRSGRTDARQRALAGNVARVAQLIGLDKTKLLLLTGALLDAQEAYRAGFLTHLVGDGEALAARALALAVELTTLAPLTLRASKEGCRRLRAAALPEHEDVLRMVYGSRDFAEGVAAFVAKRAPRWEGS